MHDVHVLNNRSMVGSIFQVYDLSGGIHRARFVGNISANEMLAVEGTFTGGLNDSVFIGNRAQLPADFPAYPHFTDMATASVVVLENNVALNNNVFLGNSSNLTNAQNPVSVERGAAVVQNTGNVSGTSSVAISAESGKRTLVYGNTHNAGSGAAPSGIHFESAFDYEVDEGMPSHAGNPMTVNVAMNADSNGNILMLDPISAQPDGLTDLHISNPTKLTYGGITYDFGEEPYDVKYSNLTVNVAKTGSGNWFLGGKSEMPGASNWNINDGSLTLATVNYGGTIGTQNAGINLSNATTANFTLGSSATLAGSGTITAKNIALNGTVRPGTWVNTGTLASDISNTISDTDIAAIDVVQSSAFGTLAFTGDVAMTGAKVYANVGSSTDKNLLDVSGSLTLNGNANELFIRPRSDAAFSNVAVISAANGISGDFDPANVFVTTPAFLNMTAVANKVGNHIEVSSTGVNLIWDETDTTTTNGTFNLDADTPFFSINAALTGANKPLIKEGAGTLFLNAANTYTGPTAVDAGTLVVGETVALSSTAQVASKVEVAAGATIGGHGTLLGGLVLNAGAIVSPGASIGTLTAHGDVGAPGTIYEMEINADGTADRFIVENGQIALTDSTLKIVRGAGSAAFGLSTTYTGIIQASGGVVDTFATIDNTLPLMDADVTYHPNSVDLTMTRNNIAFATLGASANQVRVGQALDTLDANHPVADAVSQLTAEGIRGALDNLSGEIYASARSALLGNRHLQNTLKQRMQNGGNTPLWANTWGYSGHLSGNANAARVDQRGLGLALGGDWQLGSALRAGAVLTYEDGRVKTNGADAARRNARNDVDAYSAGAYLAGAIGTVEVRTGLTYSWLELETRRDIRVPDLQGRAKAKYKGSKTQVFAEVSKAFTLNSLTLAPYAGLSQSWLHTQSAREIGSAATLDVASQTDHVTQSTLGLRLGYNLPGTAVALTLDAAWARAFGDTAPQTRHRFSDAGERFTVEGVGVGKNTALIGAGMQAQLSPNAALGVGYQGQFGSNTRHHAGQVQVRVRF